MPNNENNNQWGSSEPDPNDGWGQAPEHLSQQSGEGNSQSDSANHHEAEQAAANQPSEPNKSRRLPILIASLVVVALVLLAAGGWYLAKRNNGPENNSAQAPASQTSPNEHANSPKQVKPKTADSADQNSGTNTGSCDPHSPKSDMRNPVKGFCDGQWMLLGDYGTDSMALYYWTGKEWGTYVPDGQFTEGAMTDCYATDKLRDAQAPIDLISTMSRDEMLCNSSARMNDSSGSPSSKSDRGGNEQHHSQPKSKPRDTDLPPGGDWLPIVGCSGDYVLIVDSVLVYHGQDPRPLVERSLAAHPGAKATYPEQCGSLRPMSDGAYVYPVFIEYGSNLAGVCAAQARGEGNARKLQEAADYSSPCK